MEPVTTALLIKPAMSLVGRLLQPLTKQLEVELGAHTQVAIDRLFGGYKKYLENAYDRHTYFNSVVFKNEQRKLEDYYVPLTIKNTKNSTEIEISNFPTTTLRELRRLLLVDTAGMGKTTLLKLLFLRCVQEEVAIPLFVELRKLSRKKSLLDFILEQLADSQGKSKPDLFFRLLQSGGFVIFLDGYDEIQDSERQDVTAAIQSFIEKAPENQYIISSRDEQGLVAFPSFQRYTINPLAKDEAYSLLRKYSDAKLADSLIEKLELPENSAIHEFLTNPLLTSLLFKSFEYKHTIPLQRHIFYRQVYEALFENHDLTKEGGEFQRGKRSGLDIDRFERMLRAFGALTYKQRKVELTRDEALNLIDAAKTLSSESKVQQSSMLHDLTHAVPLLTEEGNHVRWSHRSIQEYFAAQFICKSDVAKRDEILLSFYNEQNFGAHSNIILLCMDIDRHAFDRSIGKTIAKELLSEFERSRVSIRDGIAEDDVLARKRLTVGKILFFVPHSFESNLNPESEEFKNDQMLVVKFHNEMLAQSNNMTSSTRIHHGSPGIGEVLGRLFHLVSITSSSQVLPFIKWYQAPAMQPHGIIPMPKQLHRITDDVSCPFNDPSCFRAVNDRLSAYVQWGFDEVAARAYLADLDAQDAAIKSMSPW